MTLIDRLASLRTRLPDWIQDWLEIAIPVLQILLIMLVAWVLHRIFKRVIQRASDHYEFPHDLLMPINAVVRWLIIAGCALLFGKPQYVHHANSSHFTCLTLWFGETAHPND